MLCSSYFTVFRETNSGINSDVSCEICINKMFHIDRNVKLSILLKLEVKHCRIKTLLYKFFIALIINKKETGEEFYASRRKAFWLYIAMRSGAQVSNCACAGSKNICSYVLTNILLFAIKTDHNFLLSF